MSRSNYDKPFYVDVGTSIVAIRCASNHDVIVRYDYVLLPHTLNLAKDTCDRMNREVEIGRPLRNCDVGTAEEQEKRFNRFCGARHLPRREVGIYCAYKCPVEGETSCELQWAQMPYTESEATDGK